MGGWLEQALITSLLVVASSAVCQATRLLAPLLQELIQRHTDELARSITQEQGKTLADARGDVFRGLGALARWQLLPCLPAGLACLLLRGCSLADAGVACQTANWQIVLWGASNGQHRWPGRPPVHVPWARGL